MKLRLTHKGFLLVAIPFAFEFMFIFVLYQLLERSEIEATRASHYKAVSAETNKIVTDLYEGMSTLVTYHQTSTPDVAKHYTDVTVEIPKHLQLLKALVADDDFQTRTLKEVEPDVQKVLSFMAELKTFIDTDNPLSAVLKVSRWEKSIRMPFMHLMTRLHELAAYQNTNLQVDPAEEERLKSLFKFILALGILGNIVLATLAWKLTANIAKRVEVLTENTLLLSNSKELLPVQGGDDEISRLDKFFHEMANALRVAADKERQIVENLKASEAEIRTIFESMQVGLVIVDEDGVVVSVNPRMEELFAYEESQLTGKSINQLFYSEKESPGGFKETILDRSLDKVFEIVAKTRSGDSLPVEVMASNMHSYGQRRYILNFVDVTARHEVERLKKEFVAMVSHDLKTPLTSVQSSLTLLATGAYGDLNAKGNRIVESSESELTRLIQLINDLLDIAKMEAGRLEFHFKEVRLNKVFQSSINAVKGVARRRNIKLNCAETDYVFTADADRLIQVLVNLLSNAIKFSPEHTEVTISLEFGDGWTEISVKDEGRGIASDQQECVFDRFQQIQSSDGKHKEGSGLGLAICKTIIEGHNGTIGVKSEVGKGSTFWFRIPAQPTVASLKSPS